MLMMSTLAFDGQVNFLTAAIGVLAIWLSYKLTIYFRRRVHSTPLEGPPNPSWLLGIGHIISDSQDAGLIYEQWAQTYGSVYKVPAALGVSRVILCDPKAISHFYSRETFGYVRTEVTKRSIENTVGRGVLWAEGDSHKRQRKSLSPAFSNVAVRALTPIFFDSAYKIKSAWDSMIQSESGDSAIIEVQSWMNHLSLDSIGIAGFSHDFGTLHGRHSAVGELFGAFGMLKPTFLNTATFVVGLVFPILTRAPTQFRVLVKRLNTIMGEVGEELLNNIQKESQTGVKIDDKSIIGLLIKAESGSADSSQLSRDEMKTLIFAGFESTSISLTWALVELCRHPEVQTKLREELSQFSSSDPSWDQLMNGLPYLDAVFHENLRHHPPVGETTRVATADDVLPLSIPFRTPAGAVVDHVAVSKGQAITVPIHCMNRSCEFWGPDAKKFDPERWLCPDGLPKRAQDIQGHRHLLSFVDGPRTCLGRGFAQAEFKAVLSVMVRHYAFEFKDGPDTKVKTVRGLLPRPSVVGELGAKVSLRVRPLL
ncbi:uncharacterized protein FIBRA_01018 [Fibroporia radiculosa]|uniref:Cytochrome P450 n=1 Tax=Fibroporia radiculosa TaxID=599839 RepID=J4GJ50_9APHY|nr:uncharacterized protein FIBRA_01018 [Fibroporia radiculosa]CCL99010.1 predicted protein [Fibroporia radiculosa]